MADAPLLKFLGLTLPLTATRSGFAIDPTGLPAAYAPLARLSVRNAPEQAGGFLNGEVVLQLDGLKVRLRTSELPLVLHGVARRPQPVVDGYELSILMGAGPEAHRQFIGPFKIVDADESFSFEDASVDPAAFGWYRTTHNLLVGADNADFPLSLSLAKGQRIAFDLLNRRLLIPQGGLEAVLAGVLKGKVPAQQASFLNKIAIPITFAEIVAGASKDFALQQAGGAAPFHVPLGGGKASVESLAGTLNLTVARRELRGAMVSAATLGPVEGGSLRLRFNALRNSKNQPEIWEGTDDVPLAFRATGPKDQFLSPLLGAPKPVPAKAPARLVRRNDTIRVSGKQRRLPMHTWFGASHYLFDEPAEAEILSSAASSNPVSAPVDWLKPDLQWQVTRPWMRLASGKLRHARPGDVHKAGDDSWVFEGAVGASGGAPLLHPTDWRGSPPNDPTKGRAAEQGFKDLDTAHQSMRLVSAGAVHDSGLQDRTNDPDQPPVRPAIKNIAPRTEGQQGEVGLADHSRQLELRSPQLAVTTQALAIPRPSIGLVANLPADRSADWAVAWPGLQARPNWVWIDDIDSLSNGLKTMIDPQAPLAIGLLKGDARPVDLPLAILKMTRRNTLAEIMASMSEDLAKGTNSADAKRKFDAGAKAALELIEAVDPSVLEASWVGVVLFELPVDYDAFPVLKALVPGGSDAPRLKFVSLAPREKGVVGADPALSGAIDWNQPPVAARKPGRPDQEATIRPLRLYAAFKDRRLVTFDSRTQLTFHSFFGIQGATGETKTIDIVGTFRKLSDSQGYEIRFAAEVTSEASLTLLPLGSGGGDWLTSGFIEKASLRRVEIVDRVGENGTARQPEIQIDGSILFKKPGSFGGDYLDFFKNAKAVNFANLRIALPKISGLDAWPLNLQYPSLKFDLDLPHLPLLGGAMMLKFQQIAVEWRKDLPPLPDLPSLPLPNFDFSQFPSIGLPGTGPLNLDLAKLVFVGNIDFGALPDLFPRALNGLSLQGAFGINFDARGLVTGKPYIGIGGFGFSGLDFDLAGFLTLKIGRLRLEHKTWKSGAKGAALSLSKPYPDVPGSDPKTPGVELTVLGTPIVKDGAGGFFSVENQGGEGFWAILIGREIGFLEIEWVFIAKNVDFSTAVPKLLLTSPAQTAKQDQEKDPGLVQALTKSWDDGDIGPATGTGGHGWTFALGMNIFKDAFRGRVLLQDGGFMGLAISGTALKKLFNYDFVFIGIYRKDITPGEDYFYISVTLPPMAVGSLRFTGGAIAAEIYTSGDFTWDLGFPWPADGGGRQWERTLGAIVTPGQASGGFYVRKRREHTASGDRLTIAGGVALQWGLGATFGGGAFQVWIRLGVYVIVEGEIVLQYANGNLALVAFRLHGAAGILLEGEGRIDWWVISVSVGVRASAEIRAALIWDAGGPMIMPIEAELSVSAHAEACIGGGCARICRGVEVHLDIPVRYQLSFG